MGKQNRRNLYRVLHVQPDAPAAVIKASYRALMQKLGAHPDLGGDEWNAAVINQAYRVLGNPTRRREYDRQLRNRRRDIDPAARRRTPFGGYRNMYHPTRRYRHTRRRCLFCDMKQPTGIPGYGDDANCSHCGSPLARVTPRGRNGSDRRAVRRMTLRDELPFYTRWPQAAPLRGQVVDCSPMGLQFLAPQPLRPNQMIKLDGRGLSAVARVVRCARHAGNTGAHLVGVQFVTLAVKAKRTAP